MATVYAAHTTVPSDHRKVRTDDKL